MKTSETLSKAADLIRDNGWWQVGDIGATVIGSACASNAIGDVNTDSEEATVARRVLGDVLNFPKYLDHEEMCQRIFDWNDAPDQTKENVILALRLAALHAELDEIEEAKRSQLAVEHSFALVAK